MKAKKSAGILLYRFEKKLLQVMLVHPGGPFWKNKEAGSWSIPKGEFNNDEDGLHAAKREFYEETGFQCKGKFIELEAVKQKSGKLVYAWALEQDIDVSKITSNSFEMEWPPKSGKVSTFPEVDKAGWFTINEAKEKMIPGQVPLLEQLITLLKEAA